MPTSFVLASATPRLPSQRRPAIPAKAGLRCFTINESSFDHLIAL